MRLKQISERLSLQPVNATEEMLSADVTGGYISDLLSDVMANAERGTLWITLQTHENIVAVAVLKELAGVVIVNGRRPSEEAVEKALQEGVPLFVTPLSGFEVAGRLYMLFHAEEIQG